MDILTRFGLLFLPGICLMGACDAPCGDYIPGQSSAAYYIGSSSNESHNVAGLWQVDLTPAVSRTNCVDARSLPAESYVYTLELRETETEDIRVRVSVEGFPMAEDGAIVDDQLHYQTDAIEDLEREAGAITYRISGSARLAIDGATNTLSWEDGVEQILILDSEDPSIPSGCVFEYDVVGAKVCNEF